MVECHRKSVLKQWKNLVKVELMLSLQQTWRLVVLTSKESIAWYTSILPKTERRSSTVLGELLALAVVVMFSA